MRNVPTPLRAQLAERFPIESVTVVRVEGNPGDVRKILIGLSDGECVEAVLIPAGSRRTGTEGPERVTVCLSSQVGCRYACAFCASGRGGFQRDLEAGEMVGQVLEAARLLGERPSNVVVMGMGEPLDNYDAVLRAIRIINDAEGLAIGARRITISTSGVIPGIRRLAGEGLQVELSVSLHAADDALRSRLMPINRRYPLGDLLATCVAYAEQTKRIVTFEYTLIRGVNDSRRQAEALAALLRPIPCRVNLIPLSRVAEFGGTASDSATARLFIEVLGRAGLNATLRVSKGSRIQAACGQLRRRRLAGREHAGDRTGGCDD
jgi:23S rRNA (adenine2503-C2)-methyltransferase